MKYFTSKATDEAYYLAFDFTNDLGTETISTVDTVEAHEMTDAEVVGDPATTTLIDDTKQNNTNTVVNFWVRAGTNGQKYRLRATITDTSDEIYILKAGIKVLD